MTNLKWTSGGTTSTFLGLFHLLQKTLILLRKNFNPVVCVFFFKELINIFIYFFSLMPLFISKYWSSFEISVRGNEVFYHRQHGGTIYTN